jgi:hypothetical protein
LSVLFKGPYTVLGLKQGSKTLYQVEDPADGKVYTFPQARLRKYYLDETDAPAELVALDTNENVVIDILDHNMPDQRKPADWDFLVRWAGHPDEEDSWLPWYEAKKLTAMDIYAMRNPHLRIPARGLQTVAAVTAMSTELAEPRTYKLPLYGRQCGAQP